ncbi:MAG: hypothetical protein AAGG46_10450 [Planctomycetota bacterium]
MPCGATTCAAVQHNGGCGNSGHGHGEFGFCETGELLDSENRRADKPAAIPNASIRRPPPPPEPVPPGRFSPVPVRPVFAALPVTLPMHATPLRTVPFEASPPMAAADPPLPWVEAPPEPAAF